VAHQRARHIEDRYNKMLQFSPILGLFGHRQVGKTTFLAARVEDYRTLDDLDTLSSAHESPKAFIQSSQGRPIAIDECQLEPRLFPTLKEQVRSNNRPGQYVLSGSVRFTSKKAIRESLAGRMAVMEMLPFSVAELMGAPLPDVILRLLRHRIFTPDSLRSLNDRKSTEARLRHFDLYLQNGGLPGLCFIRDRFLQKAALNDLHDLILGRDLPLIADVRTPITALKRLLEFIAGLGLEPYVVSEARRVTGLAPQTQKRLLDAMEATFLIRRIPVSGRGRECILLEDQLEESRYAGARLPRKSQLETGVFRNIRAEFFYRVGADAAFETYLTPDGARVPIVIRADEHRLGIIAHEGPTPSLSETRSASSFLRAHGSAKVLFLSAERISPECRDDRSMACSIGSIL
jgi:hypothetical protein